jgi:methylmalonyl-CoA carboxyltransferase 12S subunit
MDTNEELLELVKSLTERIDGLETKIKSLEVLAADVPEETMVVIAAAVAAFLGERARRRQPHFTTNARTWMAATRRSQHLHSPAL